MSTTDWPARVTPAAAQWQLQKAGTQFASPFNGTAQAVDYVAERWAVSLSLPNQASPGAVAALLNNLSGGVNRVNLWHHGSGGQPAGSLRGAPVLSSAASRGDASIQIGQCTSASNMINGGSFEIDTNLDGLADGWVVFVGGAGDGSRTHTLSTVPTGAAAQGAKVQFVQIAAATNTNDTGILKSARPTVVAGVRYTLSAAIRASVGGKVYLTARAYNAGGASIVDFSSSYVPATGVLVNTSVNFLAPVGTVAVEIAIRGITMPAEFIEADAVQLEVGEVATRYASPATLLAGDMIGCSGHLLQVASDCQANDAGAMTVPLVNRIRATIASSTLVTWYRPTAQFIMPAMAAGSLQVPGYTQGAALDLLEVW